MRSDDVVDALTVGVCDPIPLVVAGLRSQLGCDVTAVRGDEVDTWARPRERPVWVLSLVDRSAWESLRIVASIDFGPPIVALLDAPTPLSTADAVNAGATSVYDRFAEPEDLAAVIRCTPAGNGIVPAGMTASSDPNSEWTDEERAWLRSLARGTSVGDLAWEFGYSRRTMARRLHDIYLRLGTQRQPQALAEATRRGLIR